MINLLATSFFIRPVIHERPDPSHRWGWSVPEAATQNMISSLFIVDPMIAQLRVLCVNMVTVKRDLTCKPLSQHHMGNTVMAQPLSTPIGIVSNGLNRDCHCVNL